MSDALIALFAALVGGALTGGAAIASIWVQHRSERQREFIRLAFQAAIEDFKIRAAAADRYAASSTPMSVYPLTVWIHHHWRIADLMHKRTFDAKSLETLMTEQWEMLAVIDKAQRPRGGV